MAYHAELNGVPPYFHSFYGYYQAYHPIPTHFMAIIRHTAWILLSLVVNSVISVRLELISHCIKRRFNFRTIYLTLMIIY